MAGNLEAILIHLSIVDVFNKRPNLFYENECYLIFIHVLPFTQGYLNSK